MLAAAGFAYEVEGKGEPVLLIHGSHVADAFLPLLLEPSLTSRFRLVRYHRRGFVKSPPHTGPFGIEQQARDALQLAGALGLERFHLVGHSYGAVTALQLALEAPRAVHSLVLLEPPLGAADGDSALSAHLGRALALYAAGDARGAVDAFMSAMGGPDWAAELSKPLPGSAEQAYRDAKTFFEVEVPALGAWRFAESEARRIRQPVLYLVGGESGPFFEQGSRRFAALVPHVEVVTLPGLDHMLQVRSPSRVARELVDFLARHPLAA